MKDILSTLPSGGLGDDRVVLRPIRIDDAEAYLRGVNDPAVVRFSGIPMDRQSLAAAEDRIRNAEKAAAEGSSALLVIEAKDEPRFLGAIGLDQIDDANRSANFGFWLVPSARHRGIAPRALRIVTAWCVEALGLETLTASVDPDNVPSIRTLETFGFQPAGTPRSPRLFTFPLTKVGRT